MRCENYNQFTNSPEDHHLVSWRVVHHWNNLPQNVSQATAVSHRWKDVSATIWSYGPIKFITTIICRKQKLGKNILIVLWSWNVIAFLPRCMQCRRGLAMRILSVRLSVRHTRGLWQNGRKFCPDLYTIRKNIYPSFLRRRMVGRGRPLLGEILGQPIPVGAKSPIFNQ